MRAFERAVRCGYCGRILNYMTRENDAAGQSSWSSPNQLLLLGFIGQVVGALVFWVQVDDWAGRTWSTRDFLEWVKLSIALAVLFAALVGVSTRRWWTVASVLMGCLSATALGCAVFIAYAVVNSA